MSFGHALYYPHINLTDKNWIKHALLFWDKISRIVPESVEPSDSEEIIKIKYELGFIEDYSPDEWDTSNTFNEFGKILIQLIESNLFFKHKYFERFANPRHFVKDYNDRRRFFSELVQANGTYIHVKKLDRKFKEFLIDIGIAIPGKDEWEDWVKVENEIGLLYMTYFAKTISKKKTLPIVTDVEQSFSASINFESSINSDYQSKFEYNLGSLLIKTIVPKNINDVPLDKLLEIRRKYDEERVAFFQSITDLSSSITEIDNTSALKDAINHYSKLIIRETSILEKQYKAHRIETINKFLGISVPTTLVSLVDKVPNNIKPYLITSGVLFGIISAANSVKKEKLELYRNPNSYLLNLKSELSGENIFMKINDSITGLRK